MQKEIKNIIIIIRMALLWMSPFWIARILLIAGNTDLGISSPFWYIYYALRFDLKAMVIWYSPLLLLLGLGLFIKKKWWDSISTTVFLLLYLAALVFGLIAVFYYPISKSVAGMELFQMVNGQEPTIVLGYVMDYWWASLLALILLYAVYKIDIKLKLVLTLKKAVIYMTSLLIICVFLARGGIALKPLNLLDAYSGLAPEDAITAVTPCYVLIESVGKQNISYYEFVTQDTLEHELAKDQLYALSPYSSKPNVCLIILESFGKEYTSINEANRLSYTPFLDSLMHESRNYTNAYANGLRSVDAVASIYSGVPSFMTQPFIGSLYTQSDIPSLPKALATKGYYTSFYHAADEQSMGFKPYLLANGLGDYFAKQQYPNLTDFDGTWGIFDDPFLQYFNDKLGKQKQPWFSSVFTLSSHHPYKVPSPYQTLPKGTCEIHQSIGYTDMALRHFFESARKTVWFKNTVFIITADHTSINQSKEHRTYRGKYGVPLLVYAPYMVAPASIDRPVQHIDIYSSIKQLAGIKKQVAMGRSILDSASHAAVQYDGNVYVYTNDSMSLQWDGVSKYKLFAYKNDPAHLVNLAKKYPDQGGVMLKELQIWIQKYNYRLLNNSFK
jgi:phosphoglycerol transferase MdoB-like AlkP superfamily enzyme